MIFAIAFFFNLDSNKRFEPADVDGFSKISAINLHSTIGVNSRDGKWAFGRFAHFWLAATFIRVKHNEYLVSRKILFDDSGFVFFCVRSC